MVRILEERNRRGAAFWLGQDRESPVVTHGHVRIVDAGDNFTHMIEAQLKHLGWSCEIVSSTAAPSFVDVDLVVLGPGPGDPQDDTDPVIAGARRWASAALELGVPTVAVCLSHQIVGSLLGCEVTQLARPNQGLQRQVEIFGITTMVGFYNSFGLRRTPNLAVHVETVIDEDGIVIALLGPSVSTLQFHPESFLTLDGPQILKRAIRRLTHPATIYERPSTIQVASYQGERSA